MRLGVLLPTFRSSPADALAAADEAARYGLDGVFAYDHVWATGSPERPAIAPFEVLATVATRQPALVVGPLVARVGLVTDDVLLGQCRALRVVSEKVVLALGTGDSLSRAENVAYGVPDASPDARRASLRALGAALIEDGAEVWIGDGAPATRAIAPILGCTLNLWNATPADVATAAGASSVSWAGVAPSRGGKVDEAATAELLAGLSAAGATWAVFAPQMPISLLGQLRA
jgi:hypothetical protein